MIALKKVEPTHRAVAFMSHADGTGSVGEVLVCRASDEADKLRDMRVNAGVSLREGANAMGLGVVDYSGLECGDRVPVDGWDAVFAIVPQEWKDAPQRELMVIELGPPERKP